jgi:hypothetical protein
MCKPCLCVPCPKQAHAHEETYKGDYTWYFSVVDVDMCSIDTRNAIMMMLRYMSSSSLAEHLMFILVEGLHPQEVLCLVR